MDRADAAGNDEALRRFARSLGPDGTVDDLDEAALALAAVLQPGLDVVGGMAALDELAASCLTPTREGVVRHLFVGEGFEGDTATYADWRNSCLDQVIARRRGLPITLSVLAIEVARRLGVRLVGVGMPAHFLVGDPADPDWFCDPFHGGEVLDRDGCRALLARITSGSVRWHEGFLAPTPNRAIVARMLENLLAAARRRPDPVRLALVTQMRQLLPELAGDDDEVRRALAVLN